YSAQIIGAAWNPTAGTTYEIELVLDTQNGVCRLFIDGVLHGTLGSTFTRSNTATRLYVGSNAVYTPCDASFEDLIFFSNVQHTANYSPGYTVPEKIYLGSTVALPPFTYTGLGTIIAVESSNIV